MSAFIDARVDDLVAVGAVGPRSARFWLRSAEPGTHVLEIWPDERVAAARAFRFEVSADPGRDGTASVCFPDDFAPAPALEPVTQYGYRLVRDRGDVLLGEGSFETSPRQLGAAPDLFAIAFMSCHQPFDDDGALHPESLAMLAMLEPAFKKRNVKRVILLGDQMYSDYPPKFSLFDPEWFARVAPPGRKTLHDCTRAEVRALYQERYRTFWAPDDYQRLQLRYPCYPIPDDHELVDNFGSNPEHATDKWRAIHDGALDACYDYQLARVHGLPDRPPSLHYSFEYGPFAVFVMDLRSQRVATEERLRIYAPEQLADLARFLLANARRPVVAIAISVPLIHVPEWIANLGVGLTGEGGDAADRWEFKNAQESRDGLMALLIEHRRRHPAQQLLLLGGDIHAGVVSQIRLDSAEPVVQVISSGVTNRERPLKRRVAKLLTRTQHETVIGEGPFACYARLLAGDRGANKNPYAGLNVGVLTHKRVNANEWALRVELLSCGTSGLETQVYARDLGIAPTA